MDREGQRGGAGRGVPTAAGPAGPESPSRDRAASWARGSLEFTEPLFKVPRGGSPGPCSDRPWLAAPTQPQGHNQGHGGEDVP